MKRNLIHMLVAVIMAVSTVGTFAACGHEHTFGEWEEYKAPTCSEKGESRRYCLKCGEYESEPIDSIEHTFGEWIIVTPASCTTDGERMHTCTVCHNFESEPIPAAHDWQLVKTDKAATCVEDGEGEYYCAECGADKTDIIPKSGHNWNTVRTKEPTCGEEGEDTRTCTVCGTEEKVPVPAKSHLWQNADIIKQPACEEPGIRQQYCANCNNTREIEIEPLKHSFDSEFTIDERATFDRAGEKSRHCLRENCNGRTEITPIDKLQEGVEIDYTFRLRLNNGNPVNFPDAVITITDKDGKQVNQSARGQIKNGVYTVKLLPKDYNVTVSGLSKGYVAETGYEVSCFEPVCSLWIGAAPISETVPAGYSYKIGDVMYDFTYTTVANQTVTLSEILKEKKLVVLNFFYVHCTWCDREFPGMQTVYEQYKKDIEIIAIDPLGANPSDTKDVVSNYANEFMLTFPVVFDENSKLNTNFGVSGYPASVIIDSEGVIAYIHKGSLAVSDGKGGYTAEKTFRDLMDLYLNDNYWKNPAKRENADSENTSLPEAILPSSTEENKRKH